MSCPVCNSPDCFKIEDSVLKGYSLKSDLAQLYGFTEEQLNEHINEHMEHILTSTPDSRKAWLYKKAEQISKLIDAKLEDADVNDISASMIKAVISANAELRQQIKMLAEMEGDLSLKQNVTIQQFNSLKLLVIGDLCPECKKKVVGQLETLELVQ